jgi:hypothetical protein
MKTLLAALLLATLALATATAAEKPVAKPAPADAPVEHRVAEDDKVRIEEVRVRGQTQSITVTSKVRGWKGSQYEVVPPTGARDPSQAGQSNGQRVWHLFNF